MFSTRKPSRLTDGRARSSYQPQSEKLESRELLYSTLGGDWSWTQFSRVGYSFAPDGAWTGSAASNLSQAMTARGFTEAQWKNEFRRAAATWESVSNLNMVEVTDTGSSLGISGNQQGDSRFGDIRVFGSSDAAGSLAYAYLPPPSNGGTRAGDLVWNTSYNWAIGSDYDIQTVALHEFGHSLGLDHSTSSVASMFPTYNGVKQTLSSDDIAGIRSIYGARSQDSLDTQSSNYDPWHATVISGWLNSQGKSSTSGLDITSNQDVDWYYVQAPANASGSLRLTMQSSGLSSLSPRMQVYNAALQLAGWTMPSNASTTFGATITLNFTGVTPGTGIFIKAMGWNGASSGSNGVGHYGLQLDFSGGTPMAPINPNITTVAEASDQGGGSIPESFPDLTNTEFFHNLQLIPSAAEFLASYNGAALDWMTEPYTDPASEDDSIAFPELETVAAIRLLTQLRAHGGAQFTPLNLFDTVLNLINSGNGELLEHQPVRRILRAWLNRLEDRLTQELAL